MKQEGLDPTGLNSSSAQVIPISSKGPSAGIFPSEGTRNYNHYNNCHQHHSIFILSMQIMDDSTKGNRLAGLMSQHDTEKVS